MNPNTCVLVVLQAITPTGTFEVHATVPVGQIHNPPIFVCWNQSPECELGLWNLLAEHLLKLKGINPIDLVSSFNEKVTLHESQCVDTSLREYAEMSSD